MSIRQQVKEKIAELSEQAKTLEALQNEVDALAQPDSVPFAQPDIIKGTTKRKNVQKMIKEVIQAEHLAIIASIDESPTKAFEHFNYSKLNDAQKKIYKDLIIEAREAELNAGKQELQDRLNISFE
jgi:hypothetical protein